MLRATLCFFAVRASALTLSAFAFAMICAGLPLAPVQAQNAGATNGGAGTFLSRDNPANLGGENAASGAAFGNNSANTVGGNNANDTSLPQVARLLQAPAALPNDAGQIWRTYDISPYTRRITSVKQPEQTVIDWVLRDTGTDLWFRQPLGILTVTPDRLHVYHTPEVQRQVAGMIDRLVDSKGQNVTLGIRMVTVGRPDWRATAFPYLQPFDVQTPGVEGWLISKENAAILAGQIGLRGDYRPLEVGDLVLPEGQSHSFKRLSPQSYIRSLQFRANNPNLPTAGGQYEPLTSRFEEGYTLDVSPLRMLDQRMMEVVIKCQIDQLERLQSVTIPVPTISGQSQNLSTSVPQVVSWRLHERFRWPQDQVLLLSCGVIATPSGQGSNPSLLNLGPLLGQQRGRGDALLFVEFKGNPANVSSNNQTQAGTFRPAGSTGFPNENPGAFNNGAFNNGGFNPGQNFGNPQNYGYNPNYGNWQSAGGNNGNFVPVPGAGVLQNGSFPSGNNFQNNSNANPTFNQPNQATPFLPSDNRSTNNGFQPSIAIPNGPNANVPQTANGGLYPIFRR